MADPGSTLGEAFQRAHQILATQYRNEYVYKNELVSRIVFGKHSPRTATAILELPMGASTADLVVLNGTSTTYEIKTDLDQLSRVAKQTVDYRTRTEFVNVVVSESRILAAEAALAPSVGIIALRRNGAQAVIRPSASNLPNLDLDHLFLLLRTSEAVSVLHSTLGYEVDVPRGHVWARCRALFKELSIEEAHQAVVAQLKLRGTNAATLATAANFPTSLRAMAYHLEPTPREADRIAERLALPASA